ncbi:3-oxoacyl-[acyl-carrier-protein] reductase, putative [Talaromyces stipitatus ATCC 10500]|uniref:3-oxoacyl-[acyl-carrier-protein] reductase, putative n=1 Tax=Talaromyces stipitatus (strain ATCC 10500 / CBS 375.48 / QM 6759 / NRRL 1006) TaxID=441959 RepID=B8MG49_TALSN|nr:3-oxoacyl-[acyl-carrier-protein] reductase, putative [Talaromyces stipitatus ATCC 10500]EED15916.1 3-oxoacyl-[acyl-carrier-protein] reductase, putative [Talaromyces stipitatus ATCC 10500]
MAAPFPSPTAKWHTTTYPTLSPARPELSAKGRTVLITGGGTGIGAETARYFAQAGASRIALLGRREQPLLDTKASIEQINGDVDVFVAPTDITNKEQVDAAFDRFVGGDQPGKIDILISNAAIVGPLNPISSVDADQFLDAINVIIKGSLYVAQAFLRHAVPQDAVIVETNSSAAHLNFAPAFVSYSVAKLAVYRLWDSLGFEFEKAGMRVYHVQPGVVNTDMNKEAGGVKAVGFEDHVSLPASFNLWLTSPEAKFLKGKFLWANWDVDELKIRAKEIEEGSEFNIQVVGWPFGEKNWKSGWQVS